MLPHETEECLGLGGPGKNGRRRAVQPGDYEWLARGRGRSLNGMGRASPEETDGWHWRHAVCQQ